MLDSVSSTVGLCHSRILGSPQLRFTGSSVSPRATRTSSTRSQHADQSLIERRKSGNRADRAGRGDRQARAYHLASVRDVLDSAKHRERVLSGALKLGAIPSIAPYLLSAALPELQRRSPDLTLHLRETITETLVRALVSGDLDLILVALPIEGLEIETQSLFGDKFVLAACATCKRAKAADMLAHERLLLLEEDLPAIRRCPFADW